MDSVFEAKYIAIKWANKDTVSELIEDIFPIPIEVIEKNKYFMELYTYKRVEDYHAQFAIHILDDTKITPSIHIPHKGDTYRDFRKIKDPETKKEWWIEDGKWKNGYTESELWNHIGDVSIKLDDIECLIYVRANSLNKSEITFMIDQFRNGLWELILHNDSITTANINDRKTVFINEDVHNYIRQYSKYINNIIANPHKILTENQTQCTVAMVKPVAKTFIEYMSQPTRNKLTSRSSKVSFNTPENMYILYTLNIMLYIIKNTLAATLSVHQFSKDSIKEAEQRLKSFSDTVKVNKTLLENEIKQLDIHYKEILNRINKLKYDKEEVYKPLKIGGKYSDNEWALIPTRDNIDKSKVYTASFKEPNAFIKPYNTYNIKPKYQTNKNIIDSKIVINYHFTEIYFKSELEITITNPYGKGNIKGKWFGSLSNLAVDKTCYLAFQFPESCSKLICSGYRYQITAEFCIKKIQKNNTEILFDIKKIFCFKADYPRRNDLIKIYKILKVSNWERKLDINELREQEDEKKVLRKKIKDLKEKNITNKEHSDILSHLYLICQKQLKQMNNMNIQPKSKLPVSMLFLQNPNYSGAHKFFTMLKDASGIDNNTFQLLQCVERIGITNLPQIYERWCLIQTVKMLVDKFQFKPEANWKQKLVEQLLTIKHNIRIKFKHLYSDIFLDLWYEKTISNGKRPDIVIDIRCESVSNHEVVNNTKSYEIEFDTDSDMITNGANSLFLDAHDYGILIDKKRLVLDAKFHENVDIGNQINELYIKKDYSEGNKNTVFIIHPDLSAIADKRETPQEWGIHSYYGEYNILDISVKDNPHYHKVGAVFLSPQEGYGKYLDNLQRLIGMFLQYTCLNYTDINELKTEAFFCISCGGSDFIKEKQEKWWTLTLCCTNCSHKTYITQCFNCGTRLIKNGSYWSYHKHLILEPYNIHCPLCNTYFTGAKK